MEKYKKIRNTAIVGIVINIILATVKLISGLLSNSQALIADGLNSLGDIITSAVTLVGNKISSKPKDEDHPYGHQKAEHIFSIIIGVILIGFALQVVQNGVVGYLNESHVNFSIWVVVTLSLTIVMKLALYIYTRIVGKKNDSLLLIANAQDYRNDVFLSLATLGSIVCGFWELYWVDFAVAILIAIFIIYTAVKVMHEAYKVLMDTNVGYEVIDKIKETVLNISGVDHIDEITSKTIGKDHLVIIKVSVSGESSVNEGHDIARTIRLKVNELENISDTVVHINPS